MNEPASLDDDFAELDDVMERDYADPYLNQYDSIIARSLLNQHERARGERENAERTGRFGEGGIEVIIKNLPRSLNENGIRTLCAKAGRVLDVLVVPKPTHKLARVVFAEAHEAHRAVELLNGYRIGKTVVSALIKLEKEADADSTVRTHSQLEQKTSAPSNDNQQEKQSLNEETSGSLKGAKNDCGYANDAQTQGESTNAMLKPPPVKQSDLGFKARSTTSTSMCHRESKYHVRPSSSNSPPEDKVATSTSTSHVPNINMARPEATNEQFQTDSVNRTRNGMDNGSSNMRHCNKYESNVFDHARVSCPRRTDGFNWPSRYAKYRDSQEDDRHNEYYDVLQRDQLPPDSGTRFDLPQHNRLQNSYYNRKDSAADYDSEFHASRRSGYDYSGSSDYPNYHGIRMGPPSFLPRDYGSDLFHASPFCNLHCPSCMDYIRHYEFKRYSSFPPVYDPGYDMMRPEPPEYAFDYPQNRPPTNGRFRYEPQPQVMNDNYEQYESKKLASDLSRRCRFDEQDPPTYYEPKRTFEPANSSRSFQQEAYLEDFRRGDLNSNGSAVANSVEPRPTEFGVSCNQLEEDKATNSVEECDANMPFAPSRLHRVGERNSGPNARIPFQLRPRQQHAPLEIARGSRNKKNPELPAHLQVPMKPENTGKSKENAASKRYCFLRDYPLQQVCAVRLVRFESPSEFYVLAEDEARRQWLRRIVHTLNKHCSALLQRSSKGIPSEPARIAEPEKNASKQEAATSDVELDYRNAVGMHKSTPLNTQFSTAELYELGDRVVVRSGNLLYRAVVDEVKKREAKTADDGKVSGSCPVQFAYRVKLIDSGQSIERGAADMCTLSHAKLWSIPKLAIRCCVHNCWPGRAHDKELSANVATSRPTDETKANWTSTQIKEALHVLQKHILKRTTGSENFLVELQRVDANGVHLVDVRNLHKVNYADLLIALGVAHRNESRQ